MKNDIAGQRSGTVRIEVDRVLVRGDDVVDELAITAGQIEYGVPVCADELLEEVLAQDLPDRVLGGKFAFREPMAIKGLETGVRH
jgi:hypothetical protein